MTVWGPWGKNVRIGVDVARTSSSATSETWLCTLYLNRRYLESWDKTGNTKWAIKGAFSASGTALVSRGGSHIIKLGSKSATFSRGNTASRKAVSATLSSFSSNGTVSVSATFSVQARSYSKPYNPSNLKLAYKDPNKLTLSWGLKQDHQHPVKSISITQEINGKTSRRFNVGPAVKSHTDTVKDNCYYRYSVTAVGNGGSSSKVFSPYFYTRPIPPTNGKAVVSKNKVFISWQNNGVGQTKTLVTINNKNVATLAAGVSTYTYTSSAPEVNIELRHQAPSGLQSSPLKLSRSISAPPLKPLFIEPMGPVAAGVPFEVSWVYNSGDGSPQSKALVELQGPKNFQASVTSTNKVTVSGLPAGSYNLSLTTWGMDPDKPSPVAEVPEVQIVEVPEVEIMPTTDGTPNVIVSLHSDGASMVKYTVKAGDRVILEDQKLKEPSDSTIFSFQASNGESYKVYAQAFKLAWGKVSSEDVSVDYRLPTEPRVDIFFDPSTASVHLFWEDTDPASAGGRIEKLVNGRYVALPSSNHSAVDYLPDLHAKKETYRVYSVTNFGTESFVEETISYEANSVFLNYGENGEVVIACDWDPVVSTQPSWTSQEEVLFSGHDSPSIIRSGVLRHETSLEGRIGKIGFDDNRINFFTEVLYAAFTSEFPVVIRRPDYRNLAGVITELSIPRGADGNYSFSLTHIEES